MAETQKKLVQPKRKYVLEGLHCAGCTEKIQKELLRQGFQATINFATRSVMLAASEVDAVQKIVHRYEPEVTLVLKNAHNREILSSQSPKKPVPWNWLTIGGSAGLFISGLILTHSSLSTLVFLAAYALVGWKVLWKAARNIVKGEVFDEHFLMSVATLGAIAIQEFSEAVGVMLFYAIGEAIQEIAVNRSRGSIQALMNIRPDSARLKVGEELMTVAPEEVDVGDVIVVQPGEKVPLDGRVLTGESLLDTSALTGEAVPRRVKAGEAVKAGMINTTGLLTVEVEKPFSESSVARILEMVENASMRKASTEQFMTTFSRYYTPGVVLAAAAIAGLPPLVWPDALLSDWIYRALTILVISCPCALVVSIPLSYFGGIGGASRQGILVKGANFLEALTELGAVALDKTGTLTRGVFRVIEMAAAPGFTEKKLLRYAALAEAHSSHPIAQAIRAAYGQALNHRAMGEYVETPGHGVQARIDGQRVLVGNRRLLERENVPDLAEARQDGGTIAYVAVDGAFAGYLRIADEIKPDAADAIRSLKRLGVEETVLLTGDTRAAAQTVAEAVGIDRFEAELLPEEKVAQVEALQRALAGRSKAKLAFVGDGINDAPVIMRADIGVAMGGLGSDAAIEAADVVIMEDQPSKLAAAIEIARRTKAIILQNIAFALGVKALFIGLGMVGVATMWEAVFGDVGVTLLTVLNASRAMRIPS